MSDFTVTVRVRPGASRTRVGGRYGDGPERILVVAVTERAVGGAATEAVLVALARAFGVRRRHVALVTGATARTKVVRIDAAATRQAPEEILRGLLDAC